MIVTVNAAEVADEETRMRAARRRAQYEIGDPSWAAVILRATRTRARTRQLGSSGIGTLGVD